jgi:hypothetical protein
MKNMKTIKYILGLFLVIATVISCSQDDDSTDVSSIAAPSNVSALVVVTPDNSGTVTITPLGESVSTFKVNFGDGSTNNPEELQPGDSVQNIYDEGVYQIVITAIGINGKTTTVTQELVVSFLAPQNLMVTIENDPNVSRKVNVTATADLATSFEVSFGDTNNTTVSGTIGDTVSFIYDAAGTYTITTTAFSAAPETAVYMEDFTVTEILVPLEAAPVPPARQDSNKISMFSNAYPLDVNVSSWRSTWSTSTLTDIQIAGDDTKEYVDADFVGVEFYGADAVNAQFMDVFHMDVWTPNADTFRVKLVDLGGASGTEGEIEFNGIAQGEWVSIDIPMSDFIAAGMTATNSIQQMIFSGAPTGTFDFYVDNVYFYRDAPTMPLMAAPTPADVGVINMFSNAYAQDVNVSSWRSGWSTSTLTDIQVEGNDTKEYIDADFVGVEFYGADAVDASGMSFFHVDVWTPNATTFRVKLVDLGGATGTEGEVEFTNVAIGQWISLDIPMSDFSAAGMTANNSIQQLIFSGLPTGTFDFYIDNVYFHN